MAIDFDAIRKKLAQVSGQNRKSTILWKPEKDKDYNIRIIAFPNNDGQPFVDRHFYYGIGGSGFYAPFQFGKADPIQELIEKLRADGSDASRDLAKKLYPKLRTYAAVIVRGEEDKGVRLWAFGKMIYQDLLRLMLDEDYGDITDIQNGRDLKITVSQPPGKQYPDTKLTPRGSMSVLGTPAQIEQWLKNIPNIDDYETQLSTEEIERRVNLWLNNDSSSESTGTTRGGAVSETSEKSASSGSSKSTTASMFDDLDAAFNDFED